MTNNLNVALIQSDIIWESPLRNLEKYSQEISSLDKSVELIVLPEMFATGFTTNVENTKQHMDGEIVSWMRNTAIANDTAIFGSVIIEENENIFNRAIFVFPNGEIEIYDKRHLFSLAGEDKDFSPGNIRKIINYKGWKIMPLVCYDLRFPVWSRNDLDYDILIYVANWPRKRSYAWQTLLKARAIENMSYVIGVNRVGIDGNNYKYSGDSLVADPLGVEILKLKEDSEISNNIELNRDDLVKTRNHLSFLNDKDIFEIKNIS